MSLPLERELLIIFLGFLFGELLLILLLIWTYRQLQVSRTIRPHWDQNLRVLLLFLLLPILLAAFILPGIQARLEESRGRLPSTGGLALPTGTPTLAEAGQSPATGAATDPAGGTLPGGAPSVPEDTPAPTGQPPIQATATVNPTLAPTPEPVLLPAASLTPAVSPTPPASPEPAASPTPNALAEPAGKIVYVCQMFFDTERDQICLMNADGSDQQRMTTDDNSDYNFPSFAPDGNSFVFSGNEDGYFEVFEMTLSGSSVQLTDGPNHSLAPEISPSGEQIVFTRREAGRNSIWIMDRNGSNPHQIFGLPLAEGWDPVWSPDGRRVQFASSLNGSTQLFQMNPDGTDVQQLTDFAGIRGRSDWSPDGLLLSTYIGEPWEREIYVFNPDGSGLRPITEGGNNLAPSFSADGNWITFVSYRDHFRNENGCEIYIMRKDGSDPRRLTDNSYCDWQPRWGP